MTGPAGPQGRLMSLDAFRGLAIAGMILVNNPGSWDYVYPVLEHAEWHGCTLADLIFPFFLVGMGMAMPFSFDARMGRGWTRRGLTGHIVRRSLILYGLGIFMAAYPFFDLGRVRLVGVLARIGIVYLVAALIHLWCTPRVTGLVTMALLLGYWALMTLVPVPGYGPGDLSPTGNLVAYLDRLVLGPHMLTPEFDPEGLLSSLPAIASTLLGALAGRELRRLGPGRPAASWLVSAGLVLVAAGWLWGLVFPLNKQLWTSSYSVFTAGIAFAVMAVLHGVVDVWGRRAWAMPLIVYGMNAIAVFVASGLLAKTLINTPVAGTDGEPTSAYRRLFEVAFLSWAEPFDASLYFALATVTFWLAVMWLLHARRIFIKV